MSTFPSPWRTKALDSRYGLLPPGFTLDIDAGYTTLVGPNNAGKSTILHAIFKAALEDEEQFGPGRICLLPPERGVVASSCEARGQTLEQYNHKIWESLNREPLGYESYGQFNRSLAARLLLIPNPPIG